MIRSIHEINFYRKQALIRVDLNVPLDEYGNVTDTRRIRAVVPTLKKILADGGCCVLISHLGRIKERPEDKYSLRHVVTSLEKELELPIQFAHDCIGAEVEEKAAALKPGEVLLLENLRFHKEECARDFEFARKLSLLGDVYVNDAFGTAHRNHTSTTILAGFFDEKCAGESITTELKHAKQIVENAEKPFIAIMGGAKVSDKILMIDRLIDKVDQLIIGGGMAYTFCRALGGTIGQSLVEPDKIKLAKELIDKAKRTGKTIHLPIDSIIADRFHAESNTENADSYRIKEGWMGVDIGPQAKIAFSHIILNAKTILWNGPMGALEIKKFEEGTKAVGEAVAKATDKGAFSLVGGGDSAAAVSRFNLTDRMSYISTGGGALLMYFEGKPLPAVTALEEGKTGG